MTLPNNICIPIHYSGDVQINPYLVLTDVLFVPQFRFNSMSVSALTNAFKLPVHFFPDHFLIQDIKNLKMIGKGSHVADLYILNSPDDVTTSFQPNLTSFVNSVSVHTWHNHPGHLSNKCLASLKQSLQCDVSILKSSPCCICPLAKQCRLSFVSNNNMSALPFDLIYCDL